MNFKIYTLLDDPNDRIPVNYNLIEYAESLIVNKILVPNKVLINGHWNYAIYVHLTSKSIYSTIEVLPIRVVKSEKVKLSTVIVPVFLIQDSEDIPHAFVEVLINASCKFLTNNFKKLKDEMFGNLITKIDNSYIHSFKYPANFEDHKYEGDENVKYLQG